MKNDIDITDKFLDRPIPSSRTRSTQLTTRTRMRTRTRTDLRLLPAGPCAEQLAVFLQPRMGGEPRAAVALAVALVVALVVALAVGPLLRMVDRRLTNLPPGRALGLHGGAPGQAAPDSSPLGAPLGSPAPTTAPTATPTTAPRPPATPSCLAGTSGRSRASALGSGLTTENNDALLGKSCKFTKIASNVLTIQIEVQIHPS